MNHGGGQATGGRTCHAKCMAEKRGAGWRRATVCETPSFRVGNTEGLGGAMRSHFGQYRPKEFSRRQCEMGTNRNGFFIGVFYVLDSTAFGAAECYSASWR